MTGLIIIISIFVLSYLCFIIYANIEYRHKKRNKSEQTEEEKFEEWLDNQW